MEVGTDGLVSTSARNPSVGYPYRDVIVQANGNPFTYVSSNPETEFIVVPQTATVSFDFRDMKYLSNKKRF